MRYFNLDSIRIATPCPAKWEDMVGDDRKRHCLECRLDVHDLSAMSRRAAEAWLAEQSGRVCILLRRRADGRVITRDCPVGLHAKARRSLKVVSGAALVLFGATLALFSRFGSRDVDPLAEMPLPKAWTPIQVRSASLIERLEGRFDSAVDWMAHRTGVLRFCNCTFSTPGAYMVPERVTITIERIAPLSDSSAK